MDRCGTDAGHLVIFDRGEGKLMRTLPALQDLPVIFVSAYGGGDTIARALEAGAADYIVKPYSPAELAARVGLALRRRTPPGRFRIGELEIDREKRRVTVAGRPVRLTAADTTPCPCRTRQPSDRRCRTRNRTRL